MKTKETGTKPPRGISAGNQENGPSRIVFNGIEYDSLDDMPTYARNLYEQAMKTAESEPSENGAGARGRSSNPTQPESAFSARSMVAVTVLVALALLLYYYLFR